MIYLAAPYTHDDPQIEHERNKIIDNVTMNLITLGFVVYSPITHGCAVVRRAILDDVEMGTDWAAWKSHCLGMLSKADSVLVLALDGWQHSRGISEEIDFADKNGIPVTVYTELDLAQLMAKGGQI